MFDNLLISIRSKGDRAEALAILNAFKLAQYNIQPNSADMSPYSARLAQIISQWMKSNPSARDFEQFEQALKSMRLVHVDLAVEPTGLFLDKLTSRVKQLFGVDAILEYLIDVHMLSGIRISFNGMYWDRSGRSMLREYTGWDQLIKSSFEL